MSVICTGAVVNKLPPKGNLLGLFTAAANTLPSVSWATFQHVITKPEEFYAEACTFMCLVLKCNVVSTALKSPVVDSFPNLLNRALMFIALVSSVGISQLLHIVTEQSNIYPNYLNMYGF